MRMDLAPHELRPGEYGFWRGRWWCKTPNGLGGALSGHEVIEHDDGTITVSPSILVKQGTDGPEWHGFLERGEWREA